MRGRTFVGELVERADLPLFLRHADVRLVDAQPAAGASGAAFWNAYGVGGFQYWPVKSCVFGSWTTRRM